MVGDNGPKFAQQIFVARPSLAPLDEIEEHLKQIWDRRVLTNRGPLLVEFEKEIGEFLGVDHVSVVANATVGLMVALMHIGAEEVITTPFSFVATANSIRLAGAKPVFADIDPVNLTLDPAEVEKLITPRTGAILAVHCYGLPCDTAGLEAVGARHNIPVIYDAAHAFGVRQNGQSLLRAGKMSVLSFHATKVFHSAEGGAIISQDLETKLEIDRLCNHGITDETTVESVGLNAKMSELHAALGLTQLRHVRDEIAARGQVADRYAAGLGQVAGLRLLCPTGNPDHNNYSYPIYVEPDFPVSRDALCGLLKEKGIIARRYFYPLIPHLGAFRNDLEGSAKHFPVAEKAAERVLCLPMYGDLDPADQMRVINTIVEAGRQLSPLQLAVGVA